MELALQTFRMWQNTLSHLLKRDTDSSDFVWLGRFRLLSIYTILKGLLLLTAGLVGARLSSFQSGSTPNLTLLLWIGIILGMTISTLLLISGLVLASKDRPRSIGLVMLGASDICVLLAVVYASILNNHFLLLINLVFISCTTPLLIERISRYARRFLRSTHELASLKNEQNILLLRFSQELVRAIEHQRLSLKREIHDGLMQELSALMLQVSVVIMRNSDDGVLHLNTLEVARLEATLRRVITEARSVMNSLHSPEPVLDK